MTRNTVTVNLLVPVPGVETSRGKPLPTTSTQGTIDREARNGPLVCRPASPPLASAPRPAPSFACAGCGGRHASLGLVEESLTVTGGDAGGLGAGEWALRDHRLKCFRECKSAHYRHKAEWALENGERSKAEWHAARSGTLTRRWTDRQAACQKETVIRVWCDGCGEVHERAVGCGQRAWCDACGMKAARKSRRKILIGIENAYKESLTSWNRRRVAYRRPSVRLITLSVSHSGDLKKDRDIITKAWQRWRAWVQKRQGACPFVLTWEVTDGRGDGHVHAHVVMVGPFLPVKEAAHEWARATGGAAEMQGFDMRVSTSTKAASYAAKYATKGCDPRSVSRETWLAFFRASWGKRSYSASRGLFLAVDSKSTPPCCRESGAEWGGVEIKRLTPRGDSLHPRHRVTHDAESVGMNGEERSAGS